MTTIADLLARLADSDECSDIEIKRAAQELGKSALETISAFSNEPGLGGGWIDSHRTPARACDRNRGGDCDHDRHERECREIERPYSEQHRLDQAARHDREHQSDRGPRGDDASRVP